MKHICLFFILATVAQPLAAQKRLYVNPAATGAATGASWADALTDLQTALALAQAGDEVWVAQGAYRPTTDTDRNRAFEPRSGVRLLGGFAGTESDPAQRDWEANSSVLSGDIGVPGDSTDNSYNVVYLHEPDSATLFDGFSVRDGNADYAGLGASRDRRKCGGGMYVMGEDAEAYPSVRNCRFERNTARNSGGGVCVNGGGDGSVAPLFFNCRFEDNRSLGNGGGLAYLGASWVERGVEIDSCSFRLNKAGNRGGGLNYQDSERSDQINLDRSSFIENTGVSGGGGGHFSLGRNSGSDLNLNKVVFSNNHSLLGPALECLPYSFLTVNSISVKDCFFGSNKQTLNPVNEGIIRISILDHQGSFVHFYNNNLINHYFIGSIYYLGLDQSIVTMENEYIEENDVQSTLIFISGKKLTINSSVLKNNNIGYGIVNTITSDVEIINTMITGNSFQSSRINDVRQKRLSIINCGILDNILLPSFTGNNQPSNLIVENSLHSDINNFFEFLKSTSGTLLTHSYFDSLDCASLPPNVTCGPGLIIGGDPMFVAPDSGDYRLQACSPLVNAGSNAYVSTSTDLAGNPRIQGGTVDIGAYEHQGPVLAAAPTALPSCPGGASGGIGIEVQEACPPVAVAWQSGATSGTTLSGLPPGEYQITVTDSKGLTLAFSATVPVGEPPALAPLPTPVACGDTLGGSAAVSVSGATAPLAFDWGALGSDSLVSGLPPGLYPVTVTDARGCTAVGSVQVDRSGNLGVDITAQAVSCHGAADGSFTVLPANGKAPFAWNWSNPPGGSGPTVGPLGPGTYEGTLTDAFGCSIGWVLPLGQPGPLQPSAFVTDATDTGKADGAILLIPLGGTGPYSALWAGGQTGLLLDSLPPGAYMATVTDANGCTATTPPVLVGVTTAAGEPDVAAGWQVLPNPGSNVLSVVLEDAASTFLGVRLWGGEGRLAQEGVLPAGAERLVLDVGDLPRGIYFVQVGAAVRKVVLR